MRAREIYHISFFTNWLNNLHQTDYAIDDGHTDEDSPVDVILRSKKTDQIINIQNVAYRGGVVHKTGTSNIPGLRPVMALGMHMSKNERKKSILNTIASKENKYPEEIVKNLVLVIEVTIPRVDPDILKELFQKSIETNFRGVYFVQLEIPMYSDGDPYAPTGFVYPLKQINDV
ncbi:MAG: hypothetical protein WDZ75_00480 [Candidatus Paceibacterota bacterium]